MALREGVVTFLFTDVEGSTRLWEESPDPMMGALRQHDEAIERIAEEHGGFLVRPRGEGDSRFIVFSSALGAVAAAAEMQRQLAAIDWATERPLLVRIAVHTGTADVRLGDYYGASVNRAARLRAIAHGGQSIMSAATKELVQDDLPPEITIRDLGEHGLSDLSRREHVYQIDVAGLRDRFPALASLDTTPNNLPTQLTEFVGRRGELEGAATALGETRLLTILGPGGAGKTRLAIQVVADVADHFPDGVFFVDLAPISGPGDIIQTVAESLGIALSTEEDLESQLLAYLAGKTQLLVFDNFEHVAAGAALVTKILEGAPNVRVIATTRSKLNIKGETVMTLSGLDTDWDDSDAAFGTESVLLFIDAAKRSDASFTLSIDDLEPLGRTLRMVGGMPLGIELAAAWVDTLSIDDIAAEIARNIDFLESDMSGIPDRHHSMRAVFEYSWTMLAEDERRMFSSLSVFRGSFTRQAAEAVAGASLRNLASLASKSLLIPDPGSGRYGNHELLRQYAEAALREDSGRWETAKAAHAEFYANVTAHAEELMPLSDQQRAVHIVEDDLDNIRAAFRHSLSQADAAAVRKFLIGLWLLHEIRGWHQAAVGLFEEVLDALEADTGDEETEIARAAASGLQAWFVALLGQQQAAADQADEAAARLAEFPDMPALLMAMQSQCGAANYLSRWEEVRAVSIEGARIASEAGEEWWAVQLSAWRALAEVRLGDLETGMRITDEGLAVLTRLGDQRVRLWNLLAKAIFVSMQGRSDEAIGLLEGLFDSASEFGYRRVTQTALQFLGEVQIGAGELDAARETLLKTLAISEQMGSVVEMAGTLTSIARVSAEQGEREVAVAMVASVLSDPVSDRSNRFDDAPVGDAAAELLAVLKKELDEETYTAAYLSGSARSLEVSVKELLAP